LRWFDSFKAVSDANLNDIEMMEVIKNFRTVGAIANEKANKVPDFPPAVNVQDFIDHIDYIVNKIGIEHVGISSDFDGGGGIEGWNDASESFNVTLELVRRGYTEEQIGMLWSGNLLRVLDQVEAVAKEIQSKG
jgi:membrane dipeptidase